MEQLTRARIDLIAQSLDILRAGQQPSGAFVACPNFPVYDYCWFRDSTFIAQALDLYQVHEPARRFYDWGVQVILHGADDIQVALSTPVGTVPSRYLHARYSFDGTHGNEAWPNFQLDGFGTFLWGLVDHLTMTGTSVPEEWQRAIDLLVPYLAHLWRSPNFDCWEEEHPDKIPVSTLCALYGGLHAVARRFDHALCTETAHDIRDVILTQCTAGHLPKYPGTDAVDASLLWACIPYGMLDITNPVMAQTIAKIETDLVGTHGGVHRYALDSYYGGAPWILLTAALGECYIAQGRVDEARQMAEWIECHATPGGELPEQVPIDLNEPHMYESWVDRWGPVACPLLWSHAAYLRLMHALAHYPIVQNP